MNALHPATQLLVVLCLSLMAGLPFIAWLTADRRDRMAAIWYAGLGCVALGGVAVAVLHRLTWITAIFMTAAMLLCIEALRRQWSARPIPWQLVLPLGLAYALVQLALDWIGLRQSIGVLLTAVVLSTLQGVLLWALWRVGRPLRSRGLAIAALGVFLALVVNLLRGGFVLAHDSVDHIFSYTWIPNAVIVSVTLAVVLMVSGYQSFMLEKAHRQRLAEVGRTASAHAEARLAARHAEELQALVTQRDEMIMASSRFSAVNSLALYNSTIVHELSQSVQALTSVLDLMSLRVPAIEGEVHQGLEQAGRLTGQMADVLGSLRDFMVARDPSVSVASMREVLEEIRPIVEGEAGRRGIAFEWREQAAPDNWDVSANRVLLGRIAINLITNAFQALQDSGPHAPPGRVLVELKVTQDQGIDHADFLVQDNGPGLPPSVLGTGPLLFRTTKAEGMGLSLWLARTVIENWRGRLLITNMPREAGGGARVRVLLPLAQRPKAQASPLA